MQQLPLFHSIAGQPVLVLGEGEMAEPKARLVARAGGHIVTDMQQALDEGARLARALMTSFAFHTPRIVPDKGQSTGTIGRYG